MKPDYSQPFHAFTLAIPASTEPPKDIQWMPPGTHGITCMQKGKAVTTTIRVHEGTAAAMNEVLQQFQAKGGTLPYFDFNHEDREQAAMPSEFFWGGSDPKTGGVRARLTWSKPGAEAVTGRAFQAFSPAFLANAKGEVVGAPKNMGGLVNEPAFKTIAPLLSRHAGSGTPTKHMPEQDELADSKTASVLVSLQRDLSELKAKLAGQQESEALKAKDSVITELKAKIVKLENAQQEAVKIEAKQAVSEACAAGKIAPQDKELISHYETLYCANPSAGKIILAKLKPDPALAKVTPGSQGGEQQQTEAKSPAEIWNAALKAKEAAAAQAAK